MFLPKIGNKKRLVVITLSSLCVCAVVLVTTFTNATRVKAETYNESNPDFKFELINSDCEKYVNNLTPYDCTGTFTQDGGLYQMKTDAFTVWGAYDDQGFAYRTYNIGAKKTDKLVVEADITERSFSGSSYVSASTGIMLRESMDPSSPEIFLHCRDTIAIVYRSQWNKNTNVKYSGIKPVYPVRVKIEKTGTQYVCYYKNSGQLQYSKIATLGVNIQGPVLAGFAAHACMGKNQFIIGGYKDYTAVGEGSFSSSGSSESQAPSIAQPTWEDAPVSDDVLLSETFTDGSMTDGKESVTNPIWNAQSGDITEEPDGNRVLTKNFVSSHSYAGNQEWTDYSASVDFRFTQNCDPDQDNLFALHVRHREIEYLGVYDYAITLSSSIKNDVPCRKLSIYRRYRSREDFENGYVVASVDIDDYLAKPNVWQNIYVEVIDNKISVNYNGVRMLNYTDEDCTIANLKGCIGITTYDTDVAIDNIVVKKLDDPLGGDYDNQIGGNFDMDIPEYLQKWGEQNRPY